MANDGAIMECDFDTPLYSMEYSQALLGEWRFACFLLMAFFTLALSFAKTVS